MAVLDFNGRLADKQHETKIEEGKAVFLKVYREASPEEQKAMFAALENDDYDGYMAIVRPLIIRQTMREFN